MRFATVAAWLAWQQGAHPVEVDPGLERVGAVWRSLRIPFAATVLTVGGTNGKGSVAAYLDSILTAAGYETGLFTSPHLHRYNERIRVHGREASDDELLAAFAEIDAARDGISLSFFEWNALAAFVIFSRAHVDVAVLEVGMGGRLDAVNLLDADVAAVVSVGLDHREWLGNSVEAIGFEKAGIFRAGRPALFGGRRVPKSVIASAAAVGARLKRIGMDFDYVERGDGWDYVGFGSRRRELPLPALGGGSQLGNAAVALAMLEATEPKLLVPDEAVRTGLVTVAPAGPFPGIRGKSGVDPRRRTQCRCGAVARREPRCAPVQRKHDRCLRDPGRQGRRSDRGCALAAGQALDRSGTRGPAGDIARRTRKSNRPCRRLVRYSPWKASPPEWPRRESNRGPATGSSYLARS